MQINVKTNIKDAIKKLDRIQRQQIPFASSIALNDTAEFVATNLNSDTTEHLDRPTPFTQKAFKTKRSSKRNLTAVVFAKPIQAEYLAYQIFGGTRTPKGRAIVMPAAKQLLNRYGNLPRRKVKTLLARPDTFSGTIKGVAGIWQRGHISKSGKFSAARRSRASNLRLLIAWADVARYTKRFPYGRLVTRYVDKAMPVFFNRALRRALATAR